jgi:hypothetical protein
MEDDPRFQLPEALQANVNLRLNFPEALEALILRAVEAGDKPSVILSDLERAAYRLKRRSYLSVLYDTPS